MDLGCCNISIIAFKLICWIAALFMVGFWIYKFHENEDVTAIKYLLYENHIEIGYPEMSICIMMPFIYENLSLNSSINVSANEYNSYLTGRSTFREDYRIIPFNNVTLNLLENVQKVVLYRKNQKDSHEVSCEALQDCLYVKFRSNFNGTSEGTTVRCFGFEIDRKNSGTVASFTVIFKPNLNELLRKVSKNYMGQTALLFNYPGQLLKRSATNWHPIRKIPNAIAIKVSAIEILRRRDKHRYPCLADYADFDNLVMKEHDETAKCRTPYQTSNKHLCTTITGMENAKYNFDEMCSEYDKEPCEEMSSIVFAVEELQTTDYPKSLQLKYNYPEKVKIIRQLKSVDLHALIGNIGGYIGLFLGMKYCILLNVILSMML